MRPVKGALAGLLILALGVMWTNRAWVIDAYRSDEAAASVRLSGVDLAYEATEIGPTPYRVPLAPDTRSTPRPVVFESDVAVPLPAPSLIGGEATLRGTVTGPDGPVPDAVVRVERHTDHGAISIDASTGEDGGWVIGPLAGGRYRVRAWLPGLMTMGRSEVRFVADDEVATFDFSLWGIDPAPSFEFVDGGPMYEGFPATVALALTWRSIDADGLVVINPLPGAEVTVETTARVEVLGGQPQLTAGDGVARVQLRCVPASIAAADDGPTEPGQPGDSSPDAAGQTVGGPPAAAQDPATAGPAGTLTARSGQTSASFALPGCLPAPTPEPDPPLEPTTAPTSSAGSWPGRADAAVPSGAPADDRERSDG